MRILKEYRVCKSRVINEFEYVHASPSCIADSSQDDDILNLLCVIIKYEKYVIKIFLFL